jgi:hypothetical protein
MTARWKDAHLVALPNPSARQLDGFRHVPFEVQPERAAIGEGGDLPLEIFSQCGLFDL